MQATLDAPGEPSLPVRCTFYAQSYSRILVADRAIHAMPVWVKFRKKVGF